MKMSKEKTVKIILAAVLVALLMACVAIIFDFVTEDSRGESTVTATEGKEEEKGDSQIEEEVPAEYKRIMALVEQIEDSAMSVYDVDSEAMLTLKLTDGVKYENEYGNAIDYEGIKPGYVVDIKYDINSSVPELVKVSPKIQVIKNLSSLSIDETRQTIRIGSDIYSYTDQLIVLSDTESLTLSELSVADDLVVRVYKGNVLSILMENGHGFIVLKNYSSYLEGRMEIGDRTSYTIIRGMRVPIAVGEQNVVITKDGMADFVATVLIQEGEEHVIDLVDYQPEDAKVTFYIMQDNSVLYIDGKKTELTDEPVSLSIGDHSIRVTNADYKTWESILVVDGFDMTYKIDLEEDALTITMNGVDGAEFYIDGQLQGVFSGTASITVPVTEGGHTLVIRKDGYKAWSQYYYIEDNGNGYEFPAPDLIPIDDVPETDEGSADDDNSDDTPAGDAY